MGTGNLLYLHSLLYYKTNWAKRFLNMSLPKSKMLWGILSLHGKRQSPTETGICFGR